MSKHLFIVTSEANVMAHLSSTHTCHSQKEVDDLLKALKADKRKAMDGGSPLPNHKNIQVKKYEFVGTL